MFLKIIIWLLKDSEIHKASIIIRVSLPLAL